MDLEAIKLVSGCGLWTFRPTCRYGLWTYIGLHVFFCQQAKQSVSVPVVANGDIRSESDIIRVQQSTGVNGTSVCVCLQ